MKKRPNILITIADDQRFDTIGALGNAVIQTPHFDRMVREGLAFTAAHDMGSTVPAVCAPSRAMLLTGRALFHLPEALTNACGTEENPLPFLPQLLRENGYTTHAVGKWHNGKAAFARSFDGGANIFFGGMCGHDNVPVHDFDPTGEYSDDKRCTATKFSTDLFADSAIEFLKNYEGAEPFFLFVAFTAPHDPRTPPAEYSYDPRDIPLPPNFLSKHPFDNGELQIRDELLEKFPRTPQAIRQHIADYYGMISHLDNAVGRIHEALERRGLAESTLVVHTADHGLAVGQHGLLGKQNMYEHSIRMPLLLRGPNIPQNARRDALCYQHDLFPTLCEAAQIPVPAATEFHSLWPLIENSGARNWSTLFSAYRDCQRMVKDEQWKLIEYFAPAERRTQLFDWRSDPYELHDLSQTPEQAERVLALRHTLAAWQEKVDDPLRAPQE
jgi:arylsulfatase A-like enzyme